MTHAAGRSARVLVVDDNPLNARLLEAQLQSAGYTVVTCHDGLTALAEFMRAPFDVVLLDVLMPPPDGIETCGLLRATDVGARVPVVFVTALTDPEVHERALAAGGNAVVLKPITREAMLAQVRAVLPETLSDANDGAR